MRADQRRGEGIVCAPYLCSRSLSLRAIIARSSIIERSDASSSRKRAMLPAALWPLLCRSSIRRFCLPMSARHSAMRRSVSCKGVRSSDMSFIAPFTGGPHEEPGAQGFGRNQAIDRLFACQIECEKQKNHDCIATARNTSACAEFVTEVTMILVRISSSPVGQLRQSPTEPIRRPQSSQSRVRPPRHGCNMAEKLILQPVKGSPHPGRCNESVNAC